MATSALAGLVGGALLAFLGAPPPPAPSPAPTALDRRAFHSLSPAEAAELARFPGTVDLSGLASIAPEVAAALATHDGPLLLDGAWLIPDDAAIALDQHAGPVALAALVARSRSAETLSPALARLLVRQAGPLSLDRLTTLDPALAEVLGRHRDGLHLPALEAPSAAVADLLAATPGPLSLDGLTTIPTPSLAGRLLADGRRDFSLVTTFGDEAAALLAAHPASLRLDSLAAEARSAPLARMARPYGPRARAGPSRVTERQQRTVRSE